MKRFQVSRSAPLVSALMLLACGSSYVVAAEKWVGPGGSNSNAGTSYNARWLEFTYAVRNLEPGDTLTVLDGTYTIRNETLSNNGIAHVRKAGFGRLDGWTNLVTTIRPQNAGGVTVIGNLNVAGSYITITGLKLYGDPSTIEPGMLIQDSHHIDILDNEVAYCGGGGINTNHCDTLRIIGNQSHHNCLRNPQQHSAISIYQPISQHDPENRFWRIEIKRNACWDNFCWTPGHLGHTDGNGIIVDDYFYTQSTFLLDYHLEMIGGATVYPHRTLIEGNMCNHNGGAGIRSYLGSKITIKNNTCVGNNSLFYYWEDGGYDENGYYNAGNLLLENSYNCHILNNVLQSRYVLHAPNNSNFAGSDEWGGDNFWENNLLHSTVTSAGIRNNAVIDFRAYYMDPQFVDDQNYDYRSVTGFDQGVRWQGHVYIDLYGRRVEPGQRVDMGAIQLY